MFKILVQDNLLPDLHSPAPQPDKHAHVQHAYYNNVVEKDFGSSKGVTWGAKAVLSTT